ncbi:carboxymuconolactone decarboxylase family protein [Nonomuraea sp. CA-141351]|uniref:carboxymuconolactone decarboxylase family protein n=1 Tax=Nonomuraea sp. CA-141351 TaxID=3239996 RepID=UPI003D8F9A33
MNGQDPAAGTARLRPLPPVGLAPVQRALYESLAAREVPWAERAGARAIDRDGSLLGPFNPLLFSPVIGAALVEVFRADGRATSLPPRVHEIVVLTVGAAWRAGYEIYAHTPIAEAAGLSDTVIEAIVSGGRPDFESAEEAGAYDFTLQLVTRQQVDDVTYARAAVEFGDEGLVDMVLLIGLYLSVCAIINAFDIGVPVGPAESFSVR